jgi:hypothetical protein
VWLKKDCLANDDDDGILECNVAYNLKNTVSLRLPVAHSPVGLRRYTTVSESKHYAAKALRCVERGSLTLWPLYRHLRSFGPLVRKVKKVVWPYNWSGHVV